MLFQIPVALVYFCVLFFLSSCGNNYFNDSNHSQFPNSYPESETYMTPAEAYQVFSLSEIVCEDGECPASVGGLMIYENSSEIEGAVDVNACSATLIDSNKVLTNAHCVPDDINFAGAGCFDRIKFNFPKTNDYPYERLDCSKIIKISSSRANSGAQVDWAVIETRSPSRRPPAVVSPSTFKASEDLKIFKIDYNFKTFGLQKGKVVSTTCKANTPHFLSRHFIGPISPIVNFSDCDNTIISGNSGSGVFDQDMNLKAVLSFGYKIDDEDFSLERSLYPKLSSNIGGGTSLVCIPEFLNSDQSLSPFCQYRHYTYLSQAKAYTDLIYKMRHADYEKNGDEVRQWNRSADQDWIKYNSENLVVQASGYSVATPENDLLSDTGYLLNPFSSQTHSYPSMNDFLVNAYRESLLVELPHCISEEAPMNFKVRLALRQVGQMAIDQDTLYAFRESEVLQREFNFIKSGSNHYRMRVDSRFFMSPSADATEYFTWRDLLNFSIPICEAEALDDSLKSGFSVYDFLRR